MNEMEVVTEIGKSLMEDAPKIARYIEDGHIATYRKRVDGGRFVSVTIQYEEVEG